MKRRHRRAVDAGVDVAVDVERLGAAAKHPGGQVGRLGRVAPGVDADVGRHLTAAVFAVTLAQPTVKNAFFPCSTSAVRVNCGIGVVG